VVDAVTTMSNGSTAMTRAIMYPILGPNRAAVIDGWARKRQREVAIKGRLHACVT
jgi:hypothetical protein